MRWNRFKKILILLVGLFLVVWLNHNHVTNWHFHITRLGAVVVHAHPYTNNTIPDTPFQKHQHNRFEYLFLSMVYYAIPLLALLLVLGFLFQFRLRNFILLPPPCIIQRVYYPVNLLRGPPDMQ